MEFGFCPGGVCFRASETRGGGATIYYDPEGEVADAGQGGPTLALLPPTWRDGPPPELNPRWN